MDELKLKLYWYLAFRRTVDSCCYRVCVCLCVCVCLFMSIHHEGFICLGLESRGQIIDVVLKTFLSFAKFLHRYFSMKHRAFLASRFILFTHQKQAKPQLNQLYVCIPFKNIRPSAAIIRYPFWSALHLDPIYFLRQHSREGSQSNQERLK